MPSTDNPSSPDASAPTTLRDAVRAHYAGAARRIAAGPPDDARAAEASACCGTAGGCAAACDEPTFGADLYAGHHASAAFPEAVSASLGCGVPTAVADLRPGEIVLDLGSGGGADVLVSARRVAPGGRAIGLDMTDEMLELARRHATAAGVDNAEFLRGYLEQIPLPEASVDVVISNCVINLAADKRIVLAEAARVLRPGGRFAVSDVIADPDIDDATRADPQQWVGCVAGALTREQFERTLVDAGFVDIAITQTHRVHPHAASAMIYARKPAH